MSSPSDAGMTRRVRLATVWLGGCSGCHMSFLDLDERLIELSRRADIVFSPFVDAKEFPENVDATLVEGAVANREHEALILQVRQRSRLIMSFGDCAVNGNVTAMRNPIGGALPVLQRSYCDPDDLHPRLPRQDSLVPALLDKVTPVHHVVQVDCFLPGCPPQADLIWHAVCELLEGRKPDLTGRLHYG